MAVDRLNISNNGGRTPLRASIRDGTTAARVALRFGAVEVPELGIELPFGTGSGQANWAYMRTGLTLTATTFRLLDLNGAITDGLGNTVAATKLKLAVVAIHDPDGTKALRVGPQNQTNAPQLGWGGTGSTVYQTLTHWWLLYEPVAGYTITAGSGDIFPIYNPTGSTVTYSILLAGI